MKFIILIKSITQNIIILIERCERGHCVNRECKEFYELEQLQFQIFRQKRRLLTEALKTLGSLDPEERKIVGQKVNDAKAKILMALQGSSKLN